MEHRRKQTNKSNDETRRPCSSLFPSRPFPEIYEVYEILQQLLALVERTTLAMSLFSLSVRSGAIFTSSGRGFGLPVDSQTFVRQMYLPYVWKEQTQHREGQTRGSVKEKRAFHQGERVHAQARYSHMGMKTPFRMKTLYRVLLSFLLASSQEHRKTS